MNNLKKNAMASYLVSADFCGEQRLSGSVDICILKKMGPLKLCFRQS